MKRFNIVVPKKYTSNGEEKTQWNTVGTLVHFPATAQKDEGYIMELFMFPSTTLKVFEQKPRDDARPAQRTAPAPKAVSTEAVDPDTIEYPADELNPEDIPF